MFQRSNAFVCYCIWWLIGELGVNLDSCAPLDTWKDPNDATAVEKTLYPCGLIANSVFTGSTLCFACICLCALWSTWSHLFSLSVWHAMSCGVADEFDNAKLVKASDPSNPVDISKYFNSENIAWTSDKNKFTDRALQSDETNIGPGGFALPQVTDPHFMVSIWLLLLGRSVGFLVLVLYLLLSWPGLDENGRSANFQKTLRYFWSLSTFTGQCRVSKRWCAQNQCEKWYSSVE